MSELIHRLDKFLAMNNVLLIDICPPMKTCVYDCIYCPYGSTLTKIYDLDSLEASIDMDKLVNEYEEYVPIGVERGIEYILIGGSGDPTLCKSLEEVINYLRNRRIGGKPIAIYVPGGTFIHEKIRKVVSKAEVVITRLDSPDEKRFRRINRAHSMLRFEEIVYGMIEFAMEYTGLFKAIITLIDSPDPLLSNIDTSSLAKLGRLVNNIGFDEIYLAGYTAGSEGEVDRVIPDIIENFKRSLQDLTGVNIEIIS